MKLYDDKKQHLKKVIHGETCVLTADHWTSVSNDPYITITAHYIDENWKLHDYVLETHKTFDRHTMINIASDLKNCEEDWNIKVIGLVHDNARNMVGAAKNKSCGSGLE